MNTRKPAEELNSLRDAYREISYTGRLADDIAESPSSDLIGVPNVATGSNPGRGSIRAIQFGLIGLAVAATLAIIIVRLISQPDGFNGPSLTDSIAVEDVTVERIADSLNPPNVNASDLAASANGDTVITTSPRERSTKEEDPFRVFVSRRQNRVGPQQTQRLTYSSRVRPQRTSNRVSDQSQSFSLFPSSSAKIRQTMSKTDVPKNRRQSFQLFPSSSRSTNT